MPGLFRTGRADFAIPRRDVVIERGFDPARVDAELTVLGSEGGVAYHLAVEGQDCRHPRHLELVERAPSAIQRLGAITTGDNDLREQRVEGAAH